MQQVELFDLSGKKLARASIQRLVEVLVWNHRIFIRRTSGEYHETTYQTLELK